MHHKEYAKRKACVVAIAREHKEVMEGVEEWQLQRAQLATQEEKEKVVEEEAKAEAEGEQGLNSQEKKASKQ